MNKLESTLKHNLDIAMQNACNILRNPDAYTEEQRLKAQLQMVELRHKLVFIDTCEQEKVKIFKADEVKPKCDEELEVSYDNGKTWENGICYMEQRHCMMAGIAGGYGYFGEGYATSPDSGTDVGLICDAPTHWRYKITLKEAADNFNAQAVSEDEWKDQEADVHGIKTR